MKILSYNVNGIRSAQSKGLTDWLKLQNPDVICFQEIKVSEADFNAQPFEALGYHCAIFPAQKKGYSGTAIFSKQKPDAVVRGCGNELYDAEGRVMRADFGTLSIICAYFPSGTTGEERQAVKMEYLDHLFDWLQKLRQSRSKLVLAGDYNICHRPIDIHDPVRNKDVSGFKPEERAWMEKFFQSGFIDSFRKFHPEPHQYSWWSYRAGARNNNKGWRIDYIAVTETLSDQLEDARMFQDAKHSDHCPVYCALKG